MIGSDISVILDQENFGVSKESDPRFVANDILISKNKSHFIKRCFHRLSKKRRPMSTLDFTGKKDHP